ncbi:biotin transporter BioY [Pseudoroseomonas cervicalis]|uniref:Biotin transporter n=1 Tax=Pseudoroseomonas cervicalis ATCC 49957 TaxID=525371 RepID=D5RSR2_9PROT|nr:biotin transporter BioY [Pseudoroseomonas cervicalis]EFH09661.1 BioY family protein [Pseudoroseomonas cervicalis ATCC 49957]
MMHLTATRARLSPLRRGLTFAALALLGSAAMAAAAQITVPMWPVPATLQSLVVLVIGALGGPALGAATMLAYLAEGAMGLPVFAGGAAGPAALMGPTAGFLLGFVLSAWLAGFTPRQGLLRQGAVLLGAHLAMFVPGVLWLATVTGLEKALMAGFVLFIPGTLVKTALALATLRAARRG